MVLLPYTHQQETTSVNATKPTIKSTLVYYLCKGLTISTGTNSLDMSVIVYALH